MTQIDIKELNLHLDDLIIAALKGEEVLILQGKEPVLKLVRIPTAKPKRRKAGSAKGKIIISDDFDEPLDDFKEYMS